jgi:hypothetical protein
VTDAKHAGRTAGQGKNPRRLDTLAGGVMPASIICAAMKRRPTGSMNLPRRNKAGRTHQTRNTIAGCTRCGKICKQRLADRF